MQVLVTRTGPSAVTVSGPNGTLSVAGLGGTIVADAAVAGPPVHPVSPPALPALCVTLLSVSYTHLTLPTKRIV